MSRPKIAWITPLLFIAATVFAQPSPVTSDTIWAGGDGKFESAPDTALVQFSISVQQTELRAAYAKAQESAQRIRQTLHDNGIDPKDAEVGYFSMMPTYSYPKRKIVGYQVNSHVTIKVHNFSKLGPIIENFSMVDTTDSLNLSYTLENVEGAKAKAVEDAYRKTRSNAEALARAGGRTLGVMSYASVDANEFVPQPRPMMMRAEGKAVANSAEGPSPIQDFAPTEITVTAHVNALFQLK
jgi:uncharacterized protein YggE